MSENEENHASKQQSVVHTSLNSNNNNNTNSDEDEMVFAYIVPHASPKTTTRQHRNVAAETATAAADDDSHFCFMSEPSLSEDGDDSDSRIRAPHRNVLSQHHRQQQSPSLPEYENDDEHDELEHDYQRDTTITTPNRFLSSSEEEEEEELLSYSDTDQQTDYNHNHKNVMSRSQQKQEPLQQQQQRQQQTIISSQLQQQSALSSPKQPPSQIHDSQQSHVQHQHHRRQLIRRRELNSPGNTSLSSWDSPATSTHKKVLLQFVMPESKYAKAARLQREQQQQETEKPPPQTRQPCRVSSPDNKPDELPRQQLSTTNEDANRQAIVESPMDDRHHHHHSLSPSSSSVSSLSHNHPNTAVIASSLSTTRQPPPPPHTIERKAKNLVRQFWRTKKAQPEKQPLCEDEEQDDDDDDDTGIANPLSFDDSICSTNHPANAPPPPHHDSQLKNGDNGKKDTATTKKKNGGWNMNNNNSSSSDIHIHKQMALPSATRTGTNAPGNPKKPETFFVFPSIIHRRMRHSSVDDSVNMTLSDSEAGDMMMGRYHDSRSPSSFVLRNTTLDWEGEGYHSADDEKTAANSRSRARIKAKPALEHRRSRSGDGVAATLVTGGTDWKGMEQDKIPFPIGEGDDDDDESANRVHHSLTRRTQQRFSRAVDGKPQKKQKMIPSEQPEPRKQVSKSSIVKYPPLPAQCPIGNYGTLPPVPDTDRDHGNRVFQLEGTTNHAWINPMARVHHMSRTEQPQNSYAAFSAAKSPYYEYSSGFNTAMNGDIRKGRDDSDSSEMSSADEDDEKGAEAPRSVRDLQLPFDAADTLDHLEHLYEDRRLRAKTGQTVLRSNQSQSPFANIGKPSAEKAPRSAFLPTLYSDDANYSTFICPRCKTRQREFFTVDNVSSKVDGAGSYLTLYFAIYVTCSLFVFGLEEGWMPLDCIYFAVITLTTAGLGDFVPTSDTNKLICSLFIYAGVSCIGLLLGSYIAGTLDNRAILDRKKNQIDACPNCAKIELLREAAEHNTGETVYKKHCGNHSKLFLSERIPGGDQHELQSAVYVPDQKYTHHNHSGRKGNDGMYSNNGKVPPTTEPKVLENQADAGRDVGLAADTCFDGPSRYSSPATSSSAYSRQSQLLGSPVTLNILTRQRHTRHASFGDTGLLAAGMPQKSYGTELVRRFSERETGILRNSSEADGYLPASGPRQLRPIESGIDLVDYSDSDDGDDDDGSSYDSGSTSNDLSSEETLDMTKSKIQAAKYVFITLRRALVNSMIIIAIGALGFWVIERFTLIDSWYFTTVLLTTTGYGDIVPVTNGGKLFATIYILVAGTILLNNMSTISMIPLELRKRRIERAVLTQFGDHLDDAALRELATGPLIQRLRLSANRQDGLAVCTREMFSLAMLVRLGKVTEQDIKETFDSFQRLDVNKEGVLDSRSVIAGMIAKKLQNSKNSARDSPTPLRTGTSSPPPPPPPPPPPTTTTTTCPDGNPVDPYQEVGLAFEEEEVEEERNMNLFWQESDGSLHVSTPGNHLFHFKAMSPLQTLPADERTSLLPHPAE